MCEYGATTPPHPTSTVKAPTATANNPSLKGQPASKKILHGDNNRFATFAVHTRFDSVQWFTADALQPDDKTGFPGIIRQCNTFEEAVHGLS